MVKIKLFLISLNIKVGLLELELKPKPSPPPLFLWLRLQPQRAAPAPQHCLFNQLFFRSGGEVQSHQCHRGGEIQYCYQPANKPVHSR